MNNPTNGSSANGSSGEIVDIPLRQTSKTGRANVEWESFIKRFRWSFLRDGRGLTKDRARTRLHKGKVLYLHQLVVLLEVYGPSTTAKAIQSGEFQDHLRGIGKIKSLSPQGFIDCRRDQLQYHSLTSNNPQDYERLVERGLAELDRSEKEDPTSSDINNLLKGYL